MANKIKLQHSLGRGVHYLTQLLNLDGTPSYAYKLETDLAYKIFYDNREIGYTKDRIHQLVPAGGPVLTVGEYQEDVKGYIQEITMSTEHQPVIIIKDDY